MALIRFHKEGYSWIAGAVGIGLIGAVLLWWLRPALWLSLSLGILWMAGTLFILNFFRYPQRVCPADPNLIYAPCDGRVVEVCPTFEPKYFHREMLQVSIFMSPLDVHVNWAPAGGILRALDHNHGTYLVAWHPKASLLNEQTFLAVEGKEASHSYAIRQIAGVFARRIRTYPTVGASLEAGEEIGFIKFGSRVDVLLPLTVQVKVQPGDKVTGALTPIAHW
ncbi:MAG: phosphatidylserine decarboxylase [Bacteroidia bacterium]|nr:phosphatidylserine decarboxylase [Bacteroidia bacterium]MCX7764947.1 phosphatidylserine decarboxylase [Bacteroidia bacterium]MDW8057740.1 phosphatidylserine decarboxylase [Bacteroidia bacterium]